jgi:hypothetical protein
VDSRGKEEASEVPPTLVSLKRVRGLRPEGAGRRAQGAGRRAEDVVTAYGVTSSVR